MIKQTVRKLLILGFREQHGFGVCAGRSIRRLIALLGVVRPLEGLIVVRERVIGDKTGVSHALAAATRSGTPTRVIVRRML